LRHIVDAVIMQKFLCHPHSEGFYGVCVLTSEVCGVMPFLNIAYFIDDNDDDGGMMFMVLLSRQKYCSTLHHVSKMTHFINPDNSQSQLTPVLFRATPIYERKIVHILGC